MLFYLDMRQIKITEQQLKNIIVGEGFSFEPYYVKNKDGKYFLRIFLLSSFFSENDNMALHISLS